MKKYSLIVSFLIASIILLTGGNLYAQKWFTALSYEISFASGDTKNYTDETSFRGLGLDLRTPVEKNISAGLFFGWHVFYQRVHKTVELEPTVPGAITGTQDRSVNSFPIMANVHYYFGERGDIRPFVGLNAGGFFMLQRFEIGISALQNDQWQWGFAPEVGVLVPVERDVFFFISSKFNYGFTGEDVFERDINHSYWNISAGFAWSNY